MAPEEEYQEPETVEVPETTEEAEQPEVQPEQPSWSAEEEAEAREWGWKPRSEWKGEIPPNYHDDPNSFMAAKERTLPFRKMNERIAAAERKAEERIRKLEAISDKALERQRSQYEAQMKDIARQQRQAVESGDTEAYDRLEAQKGMLQPPETPQEPEQRGPAPEDKAVVEQFRAANEWAQDPMIWQMAVQATQTPENQHKPVAELLQVAEQKAREYFPHKFEKPKPKPRQMVDGGGLAGGKKSAFSQLPKEAKDAFKRFADKGVFDDSDKGREEYAREYNAM